MFKEKAKKIKELIYKKTETNNKKNIENLVVFIILLIITIIAINAIWGEQNKEVKKQENTYSYKQLAENIDNNITSTIEDFNEYTLKENLEDILSKIVGVGEVNVLITYSETSQVVPMYNEKYSSTLTEETDTSGGTRKINEANTDREIIFEEKNGESTPITEKVIMPSIEGAIITAKGAGDIRIKTSIVEAVSAVTGLAQYKVQVFEMEN